MFDVVVFFDVRAFWTPPAPEWDVVEQVLAPGGRVFVAVHRGRTAPMESMALELRRGVSLTPRREPRPTACARLKPDRHPADHPDR